MDKGKGKKGRLHTKATTMTNTGLLASVLPCLRYSYTRPNPTPTPPMYFLPLHEPPTLTKSLQLQSPSLLPRQKPVSPALPSAQPHPSSPRPPCPDTWRAAGWGCPASFGTGRSLCSAVQRASSPALRAPHGSSVGGGRTGEHMQEAADLPVITTAAFFWSPGLSGVGAPGTWGF